MSITALLKRSAILLFGPIVICTVSVWFYLQGGRYIETENAYLKSEIVTLSSELSGKVLSVSVANNMKVNRGDTLVKLYDEPQRIILASKEANLATVYSELESLKAEYASKELDILQAETDLQFRERELDRLHQLLEEDSISEAQYDQAEFAKNNSEHQLQSKQQSLRITAAKLIDPNMPVEHHPRYLLAQSNLDNAMLDLSYIEIKAPISGIATNVSAHVGENIISGTNLLNLVNEETLWVEANFKETDLTYVRVGQSVTVEIDTYPDMEWRAHVESITPATGSEFSLLPAQNSSGNWVKVVQRVMVRIIFDEELSSVPLSAGMSSIVKIDTHHRRTIPWLSESLTNTIREF
jgi:membrane fusion protein (multidrug efflux system)